MTHDDTSTHRWEDDGGKAHDPLADEAARQVVSRGLAHPEPLIRSSASPPEGAVELPASGEEYRRKIGGG
jgi:hypothetical protein